MTIEITEFDVPNYIIQRIPAVVLRESVNSGLERELEREVRCVAPEISYVAIRKEAAEKGFDERMLHLEVTENDRDMLTSISHFAPKSLIIFEAVPDYSRWSEKAMKKERKRMKRVNRKYSSQSMSPMQKMLSRYYSENSDMMNVSPGYDRVRNRQLYESCRKRAAKLAEGQVAEAWLYEASDFIARLANEQTGSLIEMRTQIWDIRRAFIDLMESEDFRNMAPEERCVIKSFTEAAREIPGDVAKCLRYETEYRITQYAKAVLKNEVYLSDAQNLADLSQL